MNMHTKPPERLVISAAEVAGLLGRRCVESFYNNRKKLEAAGFPPKLPGINGWSRAAITRWIEANGAVSDNDEPAKEPTALERRFA